MRLRAWTIAIVLGGLSAACSDGPDAPARPAPAPAAEAPQEAVSRDQLERRLDELEREITQKTLRRILRAER